ncbi:proteasome accessory factor PafA2 family protein [Aestuariimicrobium kwangyangense]|uniref:proteasome accessory factor PafA2 family protein n=1 Tax=Aestuariimicrobium kwangyangense TaxID=396389 RepID=UPI0003B62DC4|nr:proteasome accessory factor PafA2 family protein [Aestuariimicrobium kwangyangense]
MTGFMSRRVRGLETEYGLQVEVQGPGGWRRLGADEGARQLFRPVTTVSATTNVFLRNGGRMYLDVGSHPEYATPECDTLDDLVAHDRAGDAVLNRLADRAIQVMADEGTTARVRLFKNNLDSHGNSYGSHENYQVRRDTTLRSFASALTPFLVMRQLLCGTGTWVRSSQEFWLSQRAAHMWDPLSSTTTRSRPMINTRDEPHADPQLHRRLHVIVGDSTLAEPTLAVRIGATELMLRAIEAGVRFERWQLADPGQAIRDVARDRSGRSPVALAAGGETSALAVLTDCLEQVRPFTAGESWLERAVELWQRVLTAVGDHRLDLIHHDIDWAVKLRLLHGDADRRGTLDPARMAQLDLAYHDVRPGQGLFGTLRDAGQVNRLVDESAVVRAVDDPPTTTRAAIRGRLIAAAQRHERSYTVDWMTFNCRDLDQGNLICPDPLAADDPRADRLVERMATEPRVGRSTAFTIG